MYSTAILLMMFSVTLKAQDKNKTALNSGSENFRKESKTVKSKIHKADLNLVSEMSRNAFIADFGKIPNVVWERHDLFDEAFYTKDGIKYTAFYDENSKLVGTTTDKTFADLPKNAQKEIKKQYKDYTVDKVIFFKDNQFNDQDMLLYGVQFEDADNYFIELSNKDKNIVIQSNPDGGLFFFKELKKKV